MLNTHIVRRFYWNYTFTDKLEVCVNYYQIICSSPTCKGHNCLDGSVCDVVDGQPKCICALLQAGIQCEKSGSTISTVPTTQPGITDYPLPKLIKCEVGETCEVPILVTDTQNKPSVMSKIDGNTTLNKPNVTQESKYPNGKYKVTIPVTASTPGIHEVCVDISQSAGQHCFKVEAYNRTASAPTHQAGGQFVKPSLPPNSTVVCAPGSTCHLVVYQKPQSNVCKPVIGEAIPGGAHIITSSAPNGNGLCETDVIYQPKAGTTSQKICVKVHDDSSGNIGESRCYSVDPSLEDPCHNVSCNSGECTVSDGTTRCRCRIGTTGLLCNEDTKNFITGNSSTKPAFVDTVKPKKIICYQGSGCGIPMAVSNNGSQSPSLQVDNPQRTVTTKPIPGTNISQAVVPTQTSGSVCVNVAGTSGDKVCYEVEIEQGPAPTQTGSSFTNNTMGPNSTVSCEAGVSCHMVIETTPESGGKCPKILNSDPVNQNDKIADVYAFTPKQESPSSPCKTDVVITPSKSEIGSKQVCIKIDKSPSASVDERCYNVDVTKGDACKHIQCLNGGLCEEVDKQEGVAVCICPTGFSGNRCQNGNESQLTPFKEEELTNEEKQGGTPKFTGTSLPETITCHLGKPCHLPLKVTDNTGKTPSIGFGHVDPGIVTLPPQVTPEGHSMFSTDVVVTPTKLGKRKICVQTKNTDNINMDEVCYNIETTATDTAKPGSPKFTEPTVSENSVVICPPGETCHIPLTYEKGSGNCEPVNEITQTPGIHVFTTPPSGQTCKVDVGFTPKPDQQGTSQMCFKPGSQGEQRCITVKVEDTSSSAATSCQSHHCHRNGFCSVPSGSQAVCTCPLGTAGTNCKNDSFQSVVTGSTDPGTKFVGTVLPREVKCYTGQPCLIPFTVNGNSQQMSIGDKDPGLNPVIEPGQKINSTNNVQYSLKVTPTSSSKKSVCVNPGSSSDSKEQICFTIDVVDPPTGQVTPSVYTGITLGPDSTFDCQTETLCHIQVQTNKSRNGNCPSLLQNTEDTSISDVHIFPTDSSSCITDVAFKPMVTETGQKQICIQTDAQSAEDTKRCFQVVVSHDKDPCIPIYCQNNGECEVTMTTNGNTGQCICPAGFTGDKCQTSNSEQVTPVELSNITSPEKPHFTATAVPKVINCVQDEPCHVPLTVTEPSGHTPSVKYGEVDPGLDTKKPVLTQINGTKDFTTDVVVTPQRPGSKKLCVQTQTSLGMNVDEICYEIHTSGPNSSLATKPTPTGSPIFTAPTVTESSTLICETGKVCHIPLTYQGLRGKCEEIIEAVNHQDGVHVFKPPVQPTAIDKTCTTDVAYKPPTAGTKELCFKPGPYGEERCLHIETKDNSLLNTSCQTLHCQNGGDCVAGVCVCTVGTAGLDCSQKTSISITEKGGMGKIVFTDTVLPQEVVCYKDENCTVPFVVTRPGATSNFIPVVYLQQTYTDLNPNLTSPTRIGNNTDSFRTELTLTPTTSVSQEVCLYLANSKEKTDLHCMKIAVIVRPTTDPVISPKFTAKTLYPDTLFACKVNAFCHLPMETELKSDKQCPTLSKDNSTTTTADIHPMETQTDSVTCTTDVVIHPTKSETGLKQVCIQINVSPSEGPRCYRLNVTAENPCVSLYCQNQGECEVTNNTGQCICRAGFTGDKCQTLESKQVTPVNLQNVTDSEKPHFTSTAVPKIIKCVQNETCHVPLIVTEPSGQTPLVKYGEVDPGLDTKKPVLTPITGTKDFTTDVMVTPQLPGSKKLCVQTQTSHGMNVDEICYEIQTSASKPNATGTPLFTAPTVTNSSTLICETGKACYIPLTYIGLNNQCEEILQSAGLQDGVHIFQPPVQPLDGTCTTDVAFKPPTAGTTELCFQPGSSGENRCVHIETKDKTQLNTSCQTLHCQNGGDCVSDKCICLIGNAGLDCSQKTSFSITDKGEKGKPVLTDTVLPQKVVCYKGELCTVPFVVTGPGAGTSTNPPKVKLNQPSPDLNAGVPSQMTHINNTDSYRTELTLTPSTSGDKKVCLSVGDPGHTSDEHCMIIAVQDRPTTGPVVISPKFTNKTLNTDTVIACKVNMFCHLPMETEQKPDKQCPTLSKDNSTTTTADIHPMETKTDGSTCSTDVVIHPTKSETGLKQVCIQINVSPSEGPRCYQLNVTKENPCVSLFCQNQGECEVTNNTGQCICRAGFTGDKCQTLESKQVTPVDLLKVTDSEKPHFTSTAVPKIIHCVQNEPCNVPLIVTEPSGQTPFVKYGKVDPGLNTLQPVVTQINGTKDFRTEVVVTPQAPGPKNLCVQTQTSNRMNVDEICYVIQTLPTRLTQTGSPIFTSPTVTNSSTLICVKGEVCHIPLTYKESNGQCEPILEAAGHNDGVHIFQPLVQSTGVDKNCTTDVAFKPPNANTTELCFKPGDVGENRCFIIEVKDRNLLNTPCQTLHCHNGGSCYSGVCVCPAGTTGLDCSQNLEETTTVMQTTGQGQTSSGQGLTNSGSQPGPVLTASVSQPGLVLTTSGSQPVPVPTTSVSQPGLVPTTSGTQPGPVPTASVSQPGPGPTTSVSQPGLVPTTSGTQPGPLLITSGSQPGPVPTTSVTQPGPITTISDTQPGPVPTTSVSQPGPVPTTSGSQPGRVPTTSGSQPGPVPTTSVSQPGSAPTTSVSQPGPVPTTSGSQPVPVPTTSVSQPGSLPTTSGSQSLPVMTTSGSQPGTVLTSSVSQPGLVPNSSGSQPVTVPTSSGSQPVTVPTSSGSQPVTVPTTSGSQPVTVPTSSGSQPLPVLTSSVSQPGLVPNSSGSQPGPGQTISGQCTQITVAQAREAAKMGRVTCTCMVNGVRKEIITQNPKATTEQLLKATGIGAGSVTGAMIIAFLIYKLVSKVKGSNHKRLPPTPRPRKVLPYNRWN